MPKKRKVDCRDCQRYIFAEGKHACMDVHTGPGKSPYKFLESLKPCEHLWLIRKGAKPTIAM